VLLHARPTHASIFGENRAPRLSVVLRIGNLSGGARGGRASRVPYTPKHRFDVDDRRSIQSFDGAGELGVGGRARAPHPAPRARRWRSPRPRRASAIARTRCPMKSGTKWPVTTTSRRWRP
jgi:hypothetical protein